MQGFHPVLSYMPELYTASCKITMYVFIMFSCRKEHPSVIGVLADIDFSQVDI